MSGKEFIRRVLFFMLPAEMVATSGTLKYRFLDWLYGDGVPEFETIWPEPDAEREAKERK